jgi:D-alanyl-D-alanine endopeptidase (penicillin-binding protein 7)
MFTYCRVIKWFLWIAVIFQSTCLWAQPDSKNLIDATLKATVQEVASTTFEQNSQQITETEEKNALLFDSSSALVAHGITNNILFQKNIHKKLSIASITKIMTAMVILDANLPNDEIITISEEDIDTIKRSRSRLKIGTTISRRDALLLAIMSSENRAAFALGRTYPGGIKTFVEVMNKKAQELGMQDTVFYDPTGLNANNRSTAADLFLMIKAAYRYPLIRHDSTKTAYQLPTKSGIALSYRNSNPIVHDHAWDIKLQKTGFTKEAGRCMVAYTHISGQPYIFILLAAHNNATRTQDANLIKVSLEKKRCFLGIFCSSSDHKTQ